MTERGPSGLSRSEIAERATGATLARTFVGFPATIVEILPGTPRRVAIQPATDAVIRGTNGRPTYTRLPVIYGVPILMMRTTREGLVFPVQVGDPVAVLVMDRPIGEWLRKALETTVVDVGTHCLDGAIAIPGLLPDSLETADVDHLVLGALGAGDPVAIHVHPTEVRIGANDDTVPLALAPPVNDVIDAIVNAVIVPNDGGAAIQAAVALAWFAHAGTADATKARAV